MAEGTPILEVRDLNVYYGQSHALQGVNMALGSGVLSVVGRNGMGKTTLCKAIMGLEAAASGTIALGGQVVVPLVAGVLGGVAVGLLLKVLGLPILFSATVAAAAFLCAAVIGLVFGFAPALKAARLNPVEALSNE